ncbi:MAG: 2-dehydropantoate 2-reductase [Chloroflexi bacterium]|nr:2-dehydropantoate 2-reductase [Chloroflexota bacterium]
MTTQSILIIGTGALATLFAARLSATGVDVTMLGTWPAGLDALRKEGARLAAADGMERAYPVRVTDDPAECRRARFALVLVKAWQTERAARQLTSCLAEDGLALTLQNGLGNREILSESLGLGRVALGVTTTGATLLGPGLVRLGGEGTISLEAHPRLAALEAMLRAAGFAVNMVADVRSLLWGKLVVNAAINPLTALLRVPNGELLQRPTARFLMSELAREAAAVARAQGVSLPFEVPESAAEEVAQRTAANRSSMLQDVLRGAPTEIDAICGAIVRAGEAAGMPAPLNRVMWYLVGALAGNPAQG